SLVNPPVNGTARAPLSLSSVSMDTLASNRLQLALEGNLNLGLPFNLTFETPYLALPSLRLDEEQVLGVTMGAFNLDSSASGFKFPDIGVQFASGSNLPLKLGQVVNVYTAPQPSTSPSLFRILALQMGASPTDLIEAFGKIQVKFQIDSLLSPLSKWADKLLADLVSNIPREQPVFSTVPTPGSTDGSLSIEMNLGSGFVLDLADFRVRFDPGSVIGADLIGGLALPVDNLKASIPLVKVDLGFDNVPCFETTVQGLKVETLAETVANVRAANGRKKNALDLKTLSKVMDSDELADKIGAITDAILNRTPLPGFFRVGGISLGVSETDRIEAFKEINVHVGMSRLFQPILDGVKGVGNFKEILDSFGFGLVKSDMEVKPEQGLRWALGASVG
ncbi:hypothetical protein HDV05_002145, partial [Chytridiales sp. JEL 0842]